MDWVTYIIIGFVLAGLFFASAAYALNWSRKNGQFKDIEKGARTIFTDEEPEGVMGDHFPAKRSKRERGRKRVA